MLMVTRLRGLGAILLPMALLLPLSACAAAHGSERSVSIAGSTSVQPYAEIVAEEYAHAYPGAPIDIQGGGSSAGITAVESGAADLGMSSRNLKESEGHLWSVEIAKDGLALIVNPALAVNPGGAEDTRDSLTLEQIRRIYAGDIANWSELGGPDAKIHIITREEGSGTRSAFEELVMDGTRITTRAIVQNTNGAMRQLVAGDPCAIGFISLGLVTVGEKPVKALRLENIEGTKEHVIDGSYPLYRSFLFVAQTEPEGAARQFVDFILSPQGQDVMEKEGLVASVSLSESGARK